jgi:hypothetical protein
MQSMREIIRDYASTRAGNGGEPRRIAKDLIAAILIAVGVSLLIVYKVSAGDALYAYVIWFLAVIFYFLSSSIAGETLYRCLIATLVICAVLALYQVLRDIDVKPTGLFDNRNSLSYAMLLACIVVMVVEHDGHWLLAWSFLSVVMLCGSRGAFVVALVWLFVILAPYVAGKNLRKRDDVVLGIVILILCIAIAKSLTGFGSSFSSRLVLWNAGFQDSTWFGHGLGSFRDVINSLHMSTGHSNNAFVQMVYELGVVPAFAIASLFCALLYTLFKFGNKSWRSLAILLAISSLVDYIYWDALTCALFVASAVYIIRFGGGNVQEDNLKDIEFTF